VIKLYKFHAGQFHLGSSFARRDIAEQSYLVFVTALKRLGIIQYESGTAAVDMQ
jgi:hypothetical protein